MIERRTLPRFILSLALLAAIASTALAQTGAFVPNGGQVIDDAGRLRPEIHFTSESAGLMLYMAGGRVSYVLRSVSSPRPVDDGPPMGPPPEDTVALVRIDMELVGARPDVVPEGIDVREERVHYYLAHTGASGVHVAPFASVVYRDVYPGIDMRWLASDSGYKYEFVVHPGGDPSMIRLRYIGATSVRLDASGSIVVATPFGEMVESAPVSFVENGAPVASRFALDGDDVRIVVGDYDRSRTLVIDPTLVWATYLGGTGAESHAQWLILPIHGVGPDGSTTLLGQTYSTNFPVTTGAIRTTAPGGPDAVLARFRRDGSLVWSTYIGGTSTELPSGVAIDAEGTIYHTGLTASMNFPVTADAIQSNISGTFDTYIVKIDSAGGLIRSTYYGGSAGDYGPGVALDSTGHFVIAFGSFSTNLATAGAFQTTRVGNSYNVAIARFDTSFALQWCTLAGEAVLLGVAIDRDGNIYYSGHAWSTSFPVTTGAYQTTIAGRSDAFVGSFDSTGGHRWGTLIGGAEDDVAYGVDIDDSMNVVIVGYTLSDDFPTSEDAFQEDRAGSYDGIVASFTTDGDLRWSTMYGGSGRDVIFDVEVDPQGSVTVAGITASTNVPVTSPELPGRPGSFLLARFDSTGARRWATRFGGTGSENGGSVVLDSEYVVAAFFSTSTNVPTTTGAYQATNAGDADLVILRVCAIDARVAVTGSRELCSGGSVRLDADAIAGSIVWSTGSTSRSITVTEPGRYWFVAEGTHCTGYSDTVVLSHSTTGPTITASGPLAFCAGGSVTLDAGAGFGDYRWSTGATTRAIIVSTSGRYIVDVLGTNGCRGLDTVDVTVHPLPRARATASATIFCPGDSVTLELPAGFVRYWWSNGDTTRRSVVRGPGTYWYSVTDANGCVSPFDSVVIAQHPRPRAEITPRAATLCPDDTLVLSAPAGFVRYDWSTGEATRQIRVTGAGSYRVSVVDANGCRSDTAVATVAMHRRPTFEIVAAGPTSICAGDSLLLYSSKPFRSYRWSTGDTTSYTFARASGSYVLTVTDTNGCRASMSVGVTVRPPLVVTLGVRGALRFCEGGEVVLDAGGFTKAYWSNGGFGPTITVRESGLYWATVEDEAGCRGRSDTVRVVVDPRPIVSMSGPVELCLNSEGVYSVVDDPRHRYRWEVTGGGTIVSGVDAAQARVAWGASGGTVRVIAEDRTTSCRDTVERAVSIGSRVRPAITGLPSLSLCPGGSIVLDAGDGYSEYRWSNGATTRAITVDRPGRLAVWVHTAAGCSGTSDSVDVVAAPAPVPVIVPDGPPVICDGGSLTLRVGSFASYRWTTGETSSAIVVDRPGSYEVTVVDSNGCEGTSPSITIASGATPRFTIVGPNGACPGSEVEYCASDATLRDFVWTVDGGTIVSGDATSCVRVRWGTGTSGGVRLSARDATTSCAGTSDPLPVDLASGLSLSLVATPGVTPCDGDTVVLDAGAGYATYRWSTGETTRTIRVTTSGPYDVEVGDAGGCRGSGAITITYAPRTDAEIALESQARCVGEPVVLDAGEHATYRWSTGETTRTINVDTSGVYRVEVADAGTCPTTDSIEVRFPAVTAVSIGPSSDVRICPGERATLEASEGFASYRWSTGETTRAIVVSTAGTYRVDVVDGRGCSASATAVVTTAALPSTRVIRRDDSLVAESGAVAYVWMRGADTLAGQTGSSIALRGAGTYRVAITSADGCVVLSDPITIGTRSISLVLDTVSAAVGDRFLLSLASSVDGDGGDATPVEYGVTLRFEPRSLFVHGVVASEATGEVRVPFERTAAGEIVIAGVGRARASGVLARIELEGLATAVPINAVAIVEATVAGEGTIAAYDGLVLLSGCAVAQGAAFGRAVAILSVSPAPASDRVTVRYEAPEHARVAVSMRDASGREVYTGTVVGTGTEAETTLDVSRTASGYYLVELRDQSERAVAPVWVRR